MSRQPSILSAISFLLVLLLVNSKPAFGQQSASGETLTLEQAISAALRNNRQVKIKELDVGKSEDELAGGRALRLPKFNLYSLGSQQLTPIDFMFKQGVFGTFPGIGPVPDKDTKISTGLKPTVLIIAQIQEPLSQHYRIGLNIEQLKLGREIAREQLRSQQQTIVNDVTRAYYAIVQSQSAFQTAEENIKLYRELDRVTTDYVAQRVALKSENLDVKTRLAKAEYDLLTLGDTIATQKEQLNNLLGRAISVEFNVSLPLETVGFEADLDAARSRALNQRPEIKKARLELQRADIDRRIKKSEFIPDVSMSFNYISPLNFGGIIPKTIASVGLTFSWEVFDWGKKKRELDEKGKTVEQAKASLVEIENQIQIDVNSKHRKLQQTRLQLRIAQLSQETARENLRVSTNKYKVQAALLSDVLKTQTALADADQQYQQALVSFWTAKADFEKAIGEDK
ncbi:MAG TPA: TolC family protein [Blastocatellia bacterium]|nr:TolC family protein [Blastocatellia bacterium]